MAVQKFLLVSLGLLIVMSLSGCKPDLQVSFDSESTYAEGEKVSGTIEITVYNKGSVKAPGTKDADENGYMVDLILSTDNSVPVQYGVVPSPYTFEDGMLLKGGRLSITETVPPGESKTHSIANPGFDITGEIPPGSPAAVYLCAVVDPGDRISETDENNNIFCRLIKISSP